LGIRLRNILCGWTVSEVSSKRVFETPDELPHRSGTENARTPPMAEHRPKNSPHAASDSELNRGGKLRALVQRIAGKSSFITNRLPHWSGRTRIVVAAVSLLVVAHFVVFAFWVPAIFKTETRRQTTLPAALAALDRNLTIEAKRLASILHEGDSQPGDRGGPLFVLGAVAAAEAAVASPQDQLAAYKKAAALLNESRLREFPEGREAQAWFLLGKSLCRAGDFEASRVPLEQASKFNRPFSAEVFALLAVANSNGADPNLSIARSSNERYLAVPNLSADERAAAELVQAEILFRLGDSEGCRNALARIPNSSPSYPAALLLDATLLMQEGRALSIAITNNGQKFAQSGKAKFEQALEKLALVQKLGATSAAAALKARYQSGICESELGQTAAALDKFAEVRRLAPQSEEAVAATLQSADLLSRQSRQADALAMYRTAARRIGDPATYRNEYVPIDAVRKRLIAAYEQCLRASQFDDAAQLSRLLQPLFPKERELELRAELLRSTAKFYLARTGITADQAKVLAAKARANFRQAGIAFARLAELHAASRAYTDDLWNAADCAMQGHDYKHAVSWLQLYLKNEARRRRAAALVMLGEAELALGQTEKGVASLEECIEQYPPDPASYEARILAAKGYIEQGNPAKAEKLLVANLEGGTLAPQSSEWRDSLFALGFLLVSEGRYPEAIARLEDATERYPNAPKAVEARYITAEAYRRLAQQTETKAQAEKIETLRNALTKQVHDYLAAAISRYEPLQDSLSHRAQQNEISANERAVLRNTYFGLAAALFDLGRFNDAIAVYSKVVNQYRNEPEVLEALLQIAVCWKRLDRPVQAQGAIAQAKATLSRLDKQTDFKQTTNYTRDEWQQLLTQMATM
jgi:TolA-binding protein